MQEKETEVIEQRIVEESEVTKKPISEGRNRATSTVPKLESHIVYEITPDSDWIKAVVHSRAVKWVESLVHVSILSMRNVRCHG